MIFRGFIYLLDVISVLNSISALTLARLWNIGSIFFIYTLYIQISSALRASLHYLAVWSFLIVSCQIGDSFATRQFRSIKHFCMPIPMSLAIILTPASVLSAVLVIFFSNLAISVEFLQCCMLLFLRDYSRCVDSSTLMITSLCQLFYAPRMISVAIFIIIFAMGPYLAMLDNFVWLQYSLHCPNLS